MFRDALLAMRRDAIPIASELSKLHGFFGRELPRASPDAASIANRLIVDKYSYYAEGGRSVRRDSER